MALPGQEGQPVCMVAREVGGESEREVEGVQREMVTKTSF